MQNSIQLLVWPFDVINLFSDLGKLLLPLLFSFVNVFIIQCGCQCQCLYLNFKVSHNPLHGSKDLPEVFPFKKNRAVDVNGAVVCFFFPEAVAY